MDIKEVIEHCYEAAERMYKDNTCSACAAEHEQLAHWLEELQAYRALGTVEGLSALVKARDEGWVVVLDTPCKPLVWGDDDCDTALCPDCGKDLIGLYDGERIVLQCPTCGQYLDDTKIITCAEAEAAVGGGEDD